MLANYGRIAGYLEILLAGLLAAALLASAGAAAETITAGKLLLSHGSPWRRAPAAVEATVGSAILQFDEGGRGIEVLVGTDAVPVGENVTAFFERLDASWRRRHGNACTLSWSGAGGMNWRLCRRSSRAGDATVFDLVTVVAGRAHHLMVVVSGTVATLPEPVVRLFAGFVAAPSPDVEAGTAVQGPEPVTRADAHWRLARVVLVRPDGVALARVGDAESRQLGAEGLLTGYGLKLTPSALEGFLEGFTWGRGAAGEEVKRSLSRRWNVHWTPPPTHWAPGDALRLNLAFAAGETPGSEAELRLHFDLVAACGDGNDLDLLLDAIELGLEDVASGLASVAARCPEGDGLAAAVEVAATAAELAAVPERMLWRESRLLLPAALQVPSGPAASLLLSVRFATAADGNGPGDALLEAARVLYVFLPAAAPP